MMNLKVWQIKEKDYNLFQKKKKIDRPQQQMTMEDFWMPVIQGEYYAVR